MLILLTVVLLRNFNHVSGMGFSTMKYSFLGQKLARNQGLGTLGTNQVIRNLKKKKEKKRKDVIE
ncbi:hypothetical protein CsSME_00048091 [Camellia sinensis var. sinensis]